MGSTTGSIIINVKGKDVTVGVNAPANPKDNELWLDTNDGQNILKYYSSKDKKWHNVNDMSGEFGKIYNELKTNYYTKTESDDSVKTIIGETTITKSDGKEVNMKDAINSVIDTANSHTTQIGKIETKFGDYSTIEDVNTKITKAQQTSEDYTIEAIKNLNIGAANLINGSTIYTEDNKLSITATKNTYSQQIDKISVDLKENETYTVNCLADAAWGTENISAELMCTNEEIISGVRLFTLYTNYQYSQTNIDKYSANGYSGKWTCRPVGNLKVNDIARILVYNTTTKTNNYILTKVTSIASDNKSVTATSLGLSTNYNMSLVISNYSYSQANIDKYSANGYSGAWVVNSISGIAVNDVVRIRLTNSTTNKYNYIIAKVTKLDTTNTKITATSMGACVISSSGGIVCKTNDTVYLKCRASGGASELRYKYDAQIVSTGETVTLQDWSDNDSFEYLVNSDFTDGLDITVSIKDKGDNVVTSNTVRLFVNIADDGSGYQYPSNVTIVDTIKAWLVCDDLTKTIYPMPYTFKCTKTGKYILWLGVNQNGKTHMFWNFKLERGDKATDWSINPVEEQATLKVSSDKINAVVSSLDSEGSITLTDKMAEVVANTISLNGNVKVNGDMIVNGAITVDKIDSNAITSDKISTDAIKSKNYIEPSNTSTPYSEAGTYLNLSNGTITSPVFVVDSEDEKGYLKNIEITDGIITQIQKNDAGKILCKTELKNASLTITPYSAEGEPSPEPVIKLHSSSYIKDSEPFGSLTIGGSHLTQDELYAFQVLGDFGAFGDASCKNLFSSPNIITDVVKSNTSVVEIGVYNEVLVSANNKCTVVIDSNKISNIASFRPSGTGGSTITDKSGVKCAPLNLGTSNNRWNNLYISSSAISTSDKNKKHNINIINSNNAKKIINGLLPKTYKFDDGTSGRTHYGLIAQDVEQLLIELGIDTKDFAAFIKSPKINEYEVDKVDENGNIILNENGNSQKEIKYEVIEGEYDYALRYEEFIAPLIKVVQEHEKEIEELKNKNTELENKYNDLLSRIEKLENTEGSN